MEQQSTQKEALVLKGSKEEDVGKFGWRQGKEDVI